MKKREKDRQTDGIETEKERRHGAKQRQKENDRVMERDKARQRHTVERRIEGK